MIAGLLVVSACGARYNTIKQKDPHEGDKRVYGDIGGPALQLQNKYEADPAQDAKATKIREKFFGDANGSEKESK